MNLSELNGEQLEARLEELTAETSEEKRDALGNDELEARVNEMEAIRAEIENRKAAAAEEARKAEEIAKEPGEEIIKEERTMSFAVDSMEYRDAFLKSLQGKALNAEERAALTEAGAVIPTEMQNKIWDQLRVNPLIAEVDMLHIPGYVTLPRSKVVNDANWLAMGAASTDSADKVDSVTLLAKKLIKTVEIEADVQAMAIPAFQSWLTNKLVEKMEAAICAAILNGAGSATVPQGVTAAAAGATTATLAYTLAGLGEIMSKLPAGYHRNAVWVMNAESFYKNVLPLAADSNGLLVNNGIEQRLLGHKVVLDENANGKVIFGDFRDGYAFNFGSDIEISSDASVEFRKGSVVYRALTLCDGAVVQGEAFVVATGA